jgi:hypothetical protein
MIFILMSVACVERGQPHRPHANAPKAAAEAPVAAEPSAAHDPLLRQAGGTGDRELIKQLAGEILLARVAADPAVWTKPEIARKLGRLNDELIEVLRHGAKLDGDMASVANQYRNLALQVENLSFFRRASGSAVVISELAKRSRGDLDTYYRLLYTALEVKGRAFDDEWTKLFIDEARNYTATAQPAKAKTFAHMLSTVMQHFSNRRAKAGALELVDKLNLIDPVERARLVGFGVSADAMIELLALSGKNGDDRVAVHFARPDSLRRVQESLLKSQGTNSTQLQTEQIEVWSRNLYLIDLAFLGELTVDQALRLIRAEPYSRDQLAREVRQAITIRFLQTLAKTSDEAQRKFFEKEVAGAHFFFHAYYSASEVKPLWDEFSSRAGQLQKLSTVALNVTDPNDGITVANRRLFAGIPQNIKYLSTYPTMMALAYYMSKRDTPISIQTPWGYVMIIPERVIEMLFLGSFKPWFDYSQDNKELDFIEMLYAFDFALRAGVFRRYKINPDDFVTEIIDRLSRRSLAKVREYLTLLESRMQGENFNRFANLCANLETGSFRLSQTLRGLKLEPLLGVLGGEIYTSVSAKNSANGRGQNDKMMDSLMLFDSAFAGRTEEVRLDLDNVTRWMRGLALSYRKYLERAGATDIDERMKSTSEKIASLKAFRVLYLKRSAALFRRLAPCYNRIAAAEEDLKLKLIQAEEDHLRQVHSDITRLRAKQVTAEQLKAKYQFRGLPSGFKGLDEYSEEGFLYNSIDSLIRAASRLHDLYPGINVNLGTRLDAHNADVRDSIQVRIAYDDADKFVAEGIRALLARPEFVYWARLGFSRLANWDSVIHIAGILARVTDPEILKEVCQLKEACASATEILTPQEILKLHSDFMKITRIGPETRRYMEMAKLYKRFDPLDLTRKMLDYSVYSSTITRLWGLYDLPTMVMTKEVLGDTHSLQESSKSGGVQDLAMSAVAGMEALKHVGYKRLARKYFAIRRESARGLFFFGVSPDLDGLMDAGVRDLVGRETGRIAEYQAELKILKDAIFATPTERRPRVDVSTVESITGPIVTPSVMENHFKELDPFHAETGNCFKNPSCAEFSGR